MKLKEKKEKDMLESIANRVKTETKKLVEDRVKEKMEKAREYHKENLDLDSKTTRYVKLNRGQVFEIRTDVQDINSMIFYFINSITINDKRTFEFDDISKIIETLTIKEVNKLNDFIDDVYHY